MELHDKGERRDGARSDRSGGCRFSFTTYIHCRRSVRLFTPSTSCSYDLPVIGELEPISNSRQSRDQHNCGSSITALIEVIPFIGFRLFNALHRLSNLVFN